MPLPFSDCDTSPPQDDEEESEEEDEEENEDEEDGMKKPRKKVRFAKGDAKKAGKAAGKAEVPAADLTLLGADPATAALTNYDDPLQKYAAAAVQLARSTLRAHIHAHTSSQVAGQHCGSVSGEGEQRDAIGLT